jgi:hypothetical protein
MVIPKISHDTLADMVGTMRSRFSFFMKRFRKPGFIGYNRELRAQFLPQYRPPCLGALNYW